MATTIKYLIEVEVGIASPDDEPTKYRDDLLRNGKDIELGKFIKDHGLSNIKVFCRRINYNYTGVKNLLEIEAEVLGKGIIEPDEPIDITYYNEEKVDKLGLPPDPNETGTI